jgi:hypothetical protein
MAKSRSSRDFHGRLTIFRFRSPWKIVGLAMRRAIATIRRRMKWLALPLVCAMAFLGGGCEQHRVAELAQLEESPEAEAHAGHGVKGEGARPDQGVKSAPDAPGPKYFTH